MPRMSWKPKSCTSRTKCSGKIENEKRWKNDHRKVKIIHLGEKMPPDVESIKDWCGMVEPNMEPSLRLNTWKRNETQLTQLTSSQKTQQIDTACLCLSQGPLEHTIDSVLLPQKKRKQKRKQQKKYHELLFNINNCLPVLHTTWDRRRSWQAFHSTHYSWRYLLIIWCMIYVCLY